MKSSTVDRTYTYLLDKPTADQWRGIGATRRAGVAVPLFAVYSEQSIGVGEFTDLRLLIDWCVKARLGILQLLPLNDVGFNFLPYDAQSSFALEPLYVSLPQLTGVDPDWTAQSVARLRRTFPAGTPRVNYTVKSAKLDVLWKAFQQFGGKLPAACKQFLKAQRYWIEDHALFNVLKDLHRQAGWQAWPADLRDREPKALARVKNTHEDRFRFYQWVQWQAAEQLRAVKAYARQAGVLIMGDLPFLVSGDSSDVWAHQDYFRLDAASGAPPDTYFAAGQRWGMPPYRWDRIEANAYDYVDAKLRCAEQYYDLYRIDHVVGAYRLWTIAQTEPEEHGGLYGTFDPPEEEHWEEHGRRILSAMVRSTKMLPCGEDLGTVPDCSDGVLEEFGIPGMDVQRWKRDWKGDCGFLPPEQYRMTGLSTISTHDTEPLTAWWRSEVGTVDAVLCRRLLETLGIPVEDVTERLFDMAQSTDERWRWRRELESVDDLLGLLGRSCDEAAPLVQEFRAGRHAKAQFLQRLGLDAAGVGESQVVRGALQELANTSSVFCVTQLQDWLSWDDDLRRQVGLLRFNRPGIVQEENWSVVMPFSLEELLAFPVTGDIRRVTEESGR